MATQRFDISYAAHTASCTFLLDDEGICRRIVVVPKGKRRGSSRSAVKCVGAQYVASLDGSAAGGLVEMPRVGASMLFARVDERGRVSLVRTGVLTSFESRAVEDPFVDSQSVETSAPELDTPRRDAEQGDDDDYYDPSERTQRIQALLPADYESALDEDFEHGNDLKTAEYASASSAQPHPAPVPLNASPTLRKPHRDAALELDDDAYAHPTSAPSRAPVPSRPAPRGVLPRRTSDPDVRPEVRAAVGGQSWEPEPGRTPPAYTSDVQVTRRRRG